MEEVQVGPPDSGKFRDKMQVGDYVGPPNSETIWNKVETISRKGKVCILSDGRIIKIKNRSVTWCVKDVTPEEAEKQLHQQYVAEREARRQKYAEQQAEYEAATKAATKALIAADHQRYLLSKAAKPKEEPAANPNWGPRACVHGEWSQTLFLKISKKCQHPSDIKSLKKCAACTSSFVSRRKVFLRTDCDTDDEMDVSDCIDGDTLNWSKPPLSGLSEKYAYDPWLCP